MRVAYEAERGSWNVMQLHPADMGASFLEVDWNEQAEPDGHWPPAGSRWQDMVSTEVVADIVAVELQSSDPERLARRWAAVAGAELSRADGMPVVKLANAALRFVPDRDGRGDGLGGLDLRVVDRSRLLAQASRHGVVVVDDCLVIGGTRFYLVA
ncbi:MAG: hypothetical protein GX093_11565 [Xanthomonadaceae bacterium]|nr:hypothetical protein [Xanthomonadaceae bacterium]